MASGEIHEHQAPALNESDHVKNNGEYVDNERIAKKINLSVKQRLNKIIGGPARMTWGPDGRRLLLLKYNGTLTELGVEMLVRPARRRDLPDVREVSLKQLSSFDISDAIIGCVKWNPSGQLFLEGWLQRTWTVWEANSRRKIAFSKGGDGEFNWNFDLPRFMVCGPEGLELWNGSTGELIATWEMSGERWLCRLPDGRVHLDGGDPSAYRLALPRPDGAAEYYLPLGGYADVLHQPDAVAEALRTGVPPGGWEPSIPLPTWDGERHIVDGSFQVAPNSAEHHAPEPEAEAEEAVVKPGTSRPPGAEEPGFGLPEMTGVSRRKLGTWRKVVQLVLMTVAEVELHAALRLLRPPKDQSTVLRMAIGQETYYLGRFGAHTVAVTRCGMGSIGLDSAILAAKAAIDTWRPRGVIAVGIAFGRDPSKQRAGDVLVATQVISYEPQRAGSKEVVPRGPIVESGPALLNRFRNVLHWSHPRQDGSSCRFHLGPMLSGEKLVDDPGFKAELFRRYPQAIGGEMEGAGVYAAAARARLDWALVKAVCDWADGKKSDDHQPLAAAAAASLVHHVLSDPFALEGMGRG